MWSAGTVKPTESLLIAAKNNAIRTNYIRAKIDKTKQNSKYMLTRDREVAFNHKMNTCGKLVLTKV